MYYNELSRGNAQKSIYHCLTTEILFTDFSTISSRQILIVIVMQPRWWYYIFCFLCWLSVWLQSIQLFTWIRQRTSIRILHNTLEVDVVSLSSEKSLVWRCLITRFKVSGELLRNLRLFDVAKLIYNRVVPPLERKGEGINPNISERRSAQSSGTTCTTKSSYFIQPSSKDNCQKIGDTPVSHQSSRREIKTTLRTTDLFL